MLFETAKFVVVQPKRFFNVFFGLIGTDLADIQRYEPSIY